ncbi:hypothetical protein [Streptomyces sp. NPDC088733]|uniref:hypothetical protein n=1 Tax=Streptomyces sp. NPDC088733 TaxID=3365880 RepID=UPI003801032E
MCRAARAATAAALTLAFALGALALTAWLAGHDAYTARVTPHPTPNQEPRP